MSWFDGKGDPILDRLEESLDKAIDTVTQKQSSSPKKPMSKRKKKALLYGLGGVGTLAAGSFFWDQIKSPIIFGGMGASGLALAGMVFAHSQYRKQAKERMEYFQIIPHSDTTVNRDRIANLVASFHQMNRSSRKRLIRGREWFQLYFICVEDATRPETGRIEIYCGFPRDRFSYAKKKLIL